MPFATPAIDLQLFTLANETWKNGVFDVLMPLVSSKYLFFGIFVILAGWAVIRRGPKALIPFGVVLAGLGLTDFTTNFIKDAIGRVRPLNGLPGTWYIESGHWIQRPDDFLPNKTHGSSYPSAHAANTMCLATLCMVLWKRTRPWILVVPLVVGYSRLYLGKHYPSDVLMGWLYGLVTGGYTALAWVYLVRDRLPKSAR